MMQAEIIWKGYLLALNTHPGSLGTDAVLSALNILATADSTQVIGRLRDGTNGLMKDVFDVSTRNDVRDDDWPPQGYIDLYFKNRDLLENKCERSLGVLVVWS